MRSLSKPSIFSPLLAGLAVLALVHSTARAVDDEADWTWTDATELMVRGQAWKDTASPFDRFPSRAEEVVRPAVWYLSRDAAGLYVEFITDASAVAARWTLRRDRLALPHMPATGVSGLDLYVRDHDENRWRWLANGRPAELPSNEVTLVNNLPGEERHYRLYLPLYNGITSLEIGTLGDLRDSLEDPRKPVVIYGTSITQGASASRPGMAYPAILGRQLNRPVINLGFSGNGRAEPEVAELLAELDPAVYVLDTLPNLSGSQVTERMEAFIAILRREHPEVPIVLVENIVYTNAFLVSNRAERHTDSSRQLRALWEKLRNEGDRNLYLIPAGELLGDDGEDTVDGTHPTDLGFNRMAEGMRPVLQVILGGSAGRRR